MFCSEKKEKETKERRNRNRKKKKKNVEKEKEKEKNEKKEKNNVVSCSQLFGLHVFCQNRRTVDEKENVVKTKARSLGTQQNRLRDRSG